MMNQGSQEIRETLKDIKHFHHRSVIKTGIFLRLSAIRHIVGSLKRRHRGLGIRIRVRRRGCSGLAYVFEYVDHQEIGDLLFPVNRQYHLYVDPKTYQYIKGSTLAYMKQGLNEGFEVCNPNVSGYCGCGESFAVGEETL